MTVADPAGDAPAAGDRDGLPRRGFSASCGTRAGTFGGPGSFAKSLPTTSHSGSSAPSPGNDLLKLRWKPEVRVPIGRPTEAAGRCRVLPHQPEGCAPAGRWRLPTCAGYRRSVRL